MPLAARALARRAQAGGGTAPICISTATTSAPDQRSAGGQTLLGVPAYHGGMADRIVEQLAAVEVLDPAGKSVRLGTLWESRPIILAMIRHFG